MFPLTILINKAFDVLLAQIFYLTNLSKLFSDTFFLAILQKAYEGAIFSDILRKCDKFSKLNNSAGPFRPLT